MSKQAAAYINLEIYEDSINLLGVAKVKLPAIVFPCVNISGAGMMGNMEVPLYGMVDSMSVTINWLTPHGDAVRLMSPKKHQLDMRVAEEFWDVRDDRPAQEHRPRYGGAHGRSRPLWRICRLLLCRLSGR